jgi:methylenetetrahydrofolate--tRNA-(uracil-5-)-methyltransferase
MEMPPATTAIGSIISHITGGANDETFQPMNVNFGLFPEIETKDKGRERKKALSRRALQDIDQWLGRNATMQVAA